MDTTVNGQPTVESLRAEATALLKKGKHADAAACLRRALAAAPEMPDLHTLLGSALAGQGQHDEAHACFVQALKLNPDCVEAQVNLGHHWRRLGQVEEALKWYREAIRLKPDWADVYNTVGLILRGQGKLAEAESHFRQALGIQPLHSDSRNSLGVILADQNRWPEAEAVYQQALRQQPKASGTHNNLGVALLVQGKVHEAIECFHTALRLQPVYADALNNLGNAHLQAGQLEEAEQSLRRALELKPDLAEACNNLARALVRQGKIEEAKVHFQQSVRLQPNYADAHKNLAGCLLLTGDYRQGWAEYEWHWRTSRKPRFEQPRWQGEPLAGRSLLLHAEPFPAHPRDQGSVRADTLQFVRYADLLCAQGAKVIVECQPALLPLLTRSPGISQVVACGQPLPPFDCHAPFLSLPGATHTTLANVPSQIPYLFVEPERIERWQKALGELGKLKVGFAWQGNPHDPEERRRILPLQHFGRLAQIDGVRLVCLQRHLGKEPATKLFESWRAFDAAKTIEAPSAEGLQDLAAVMKNLNLVITPDIDLAHLAGGLGVTVWVLLPKVPDWRWLMERADCPWYPTMRLFRQKEWGKWDDVFEQLAVELQRQPALENPAFYWAHGRGLSAAGKLPEAVAALRRGLELAPDDSALHNELGFALHRQNAKEEALASYERAVAIKPDNVDALFNLGNLLGELERREDAEKCYRQGLAHQPNKPGLLNHLGLLLLWKAQHEEAEQLFRKAARLMPDAPGPYLNNLGILLEQENRLDEAVGVFQKVLTCKDGAPDAHKNLGMIHLVRGDFPRGWTEYEWRLKSNGRDRPFEQPRWDGQPLQGKSILLWTEQGLGDTIQFIRYAELVKQRGGYVIVECRDLLKPLLRRCPGIDQMVAQGRPLPDFACHAPLLSLPLIFNTGEESVPNKVPYLSAEPARVTHWRRQLQDVGTCKVGIAWQGSPTFGNDRNRSIPLLQFEPLTRIPGVRLVSLQKGFGIEQLKEAPESWGIVDLSERLDGEGAFLDSAAVIKNLDLVISPDTSITHLAGALGAPVWLAQCQGCDWRWMREREDSPWYPTLRIFRQRRWGDWREVFERMAQELRALPSLNLAAGPVLAEISPGELLDKITILQIKKERVRDDKKLAHVQGELGSLLATRARHLRAIPEVESLTASLKKVNETLWQTEDDIRNCEADHDFGPRFIALARSVYIQNDERSRIKRAINDLLGSQLVEEKSYAGMKGQDEAAYSDQAELIR